MMDRRRALESIVKPTAGIQVGSYVEREGKALFDLTKEKGTLDCDDFADCYWRNHIFPEPIHKSVHSPPAGTMAGGDKFEAELGSVPHRLRYNLLVPARQVKPADNAVQGNRGKAGTRMP